MYYYKDGETKTIKVDKLPGDVFCYRTRETRTFQTWVSATKKRK